MDDYIAGPLSSLEDALEAPETLPARITPSVELEKGARRSSRPARASRKRAVPDVETVVVPEEDGGDDDGDKDLHTVVLFQTDDCGPPPVAFVQASGCFLMGEARQGGPGDARQGGRVSRPEALRPDVTPSTLDYDLIARKNASDRPVTAHRARFASRSVDATAEGELLDDDNAAPHLEQTLDLFLQSRGLGQYAEGIARLGARKLADLALLTDDDLDEIGLPPDERISIRISVG